MGKFFGTKKQIFRSISMHPKTASELSVELGLAPSTISEHLSGLRQIGAVELVDPSRKRKYLYYRAVPQFGFEERKEWKPRIMVAQIHVITHRF